MIAPHWPVSAPESGHPPNTIRMLFRDPSTRTLYRDWAHEACLAVASLRYVVGKFPHDARLGALVDELRRDSAEFGSIWREQPVDLCITGTKRLRHPQVGELTVTYEVLHLPEATGQRLLTYVATPGTPDADALRVLASTSLT